MDERLIDSLLFRAEGSDLDFKAEQYRFIGATDEDKSELLKDVLTMANSWRSGDAYILLGFKEQTPNPPVVVGISEFLDDAKLQQFVNSKIVGTLDFKYEVQPYRGLTIGVIRVPKQRRPLYLKKDYGKLSANTVYVRRGSSTAIADPGEIALMGADDGEINRTANVELDLVAPIGFDNLTGLQQVTRLDFGVIRNLPDYRHDPADVLASFSGLHLNGNYWRELAKWAQAEAGSLRMRFALTNLSAFSLSDCKLEITSTCEGTVSVMRAGRSLPDRPKQSDALGVIRHPNLEARSVFAEESLTIDGTTGSQKCIVRFDKVLPGETRTTSDFLALLPSQSGTILVSTRLLAHELRQPLAFERTVEVAVSQERIGLEQLQTAQAKTWLAQSRSKAS